MSRTTGPQGGTRSSSRNVVHVFDAIILAGRPSRRLDGADKAAVEVGGRALLDTVIGAAHGARRVIVVGPRRDTAAEVVWVQEDPPGGGPVAAIAAGLPEVREQWCLVLATDLPRIAAAVPLLLTVAGSADAAVLTTAGRRNHLASAWRTAKLREAIEALDTVADAAARDLFSGADLTEVIDTDGWGRDLDTWADIEQARRG